MIRIATLMIVALVAASCSSDGQWDRLARARDLSADVNVQFLTAVDASNKAVMAETDAASATFVRQALARRKHVTRTSHCRYMNVARDRPAGRPGKKRCVS